MSIVFDKKDWHELPGPAAAAKLVELQQRAPRKESVRHRGTVARKLDGSHARRSEEHPHQRRLRLQRDRVPHLSAMASRRLKSDRFLSRDFRPEIYTKQGIDWVEQSTMIDVITRHFPSLAPCMKGLEYAFQPWKPR
jgi:hypothetical protein